MKNLSTTVADVNRESTVVESLFESDIETLPPNLNTVLQLPPEAFEDSSLGQIVAAIRAVRNEGQDPVNTTTVGRLLRADQVIRLAMVAEGKQSIPLGLAEMEAADLLATMKARGVAIPENKPACPQAKPLSALVRCEQDDPDELLKFRFLCRGAIMLLCGPTGIGKSSLAMQFQIQWALGRDVFGIKPAIPIKSLLIQAENDEGDLAEMRDGVIAGLKLTPGDVSATNAVIVMREDEHTGMRFFTETVKPLLKEHKPDLLWIDPALAYLGGETNSQKDVGGFLRNQLNPLLRQFNCGCVVIHHTNKPPTGREKSDWKAGDFAYLGSGSAEWANTARAVLALRSIGSHDVFELQAGKRGSRLGWCSPDGQKSFARYLAHATEPGMICWREVEQDDAKEAIQGGRPKKYDPQELISLLPPEGLATCEWVKQAKSECGVSETTLHRERRAFEKAGLILKSKISGNWQRITKR